MDKTEYELVAPFGEIYPGEILLEYLDSNCWSQADLARRTGLTPKNISEICKGKATISPDTSLALEKAFRRPAHFWLNLQRQYDEALARKRFENESKAWISWVKKFPIKELQELRLLPHSDNAMENTESLLSFFGVSSPDGWSNVWQASEIAFRQTRFNTISNEYISAWSRVAEHYSDSISTSDFVRQDVLKSIETLRKCTTQKVEKGIPEAQAICASLGIKLVLIPTFSKTRISGCARWLSSSKALIALSNRYQTDDHLWFAFFHELGHLLLHRKSHKFVVDNVVNNFFDKVVDAPMQKQEEEANRFAADTLIPPTELAEFIREARFTNESIQKFSDYLGIAPGIMVGRLQHEEILKTYQCNKLKQKIELSFEKNII